MNEKEKKTKWIFPDNIFPFLNPLDDKHFFSYHVYVV